MNLIEIQMLDWIQMHIANPLFDKIMPMITHLGDSGCFWIILALLLLIIPKTRKLGIAMAFALLIESITAELFLKPLVARTRPFNVNPAIQLLIAKPHGFSFPSGHTAASFAAAGSLVFCKNPYGKFAIILATLIAFSRLYLYAHYPTDVLFGICFGLCCGLIGCVLMNKITHSKTQ